MSKSLGWSAFIVVLAGVGASGCEYHDCDHDPFCDEDGDHDEDTDEARGQQRPEAGCSETCDRLIACGRIPAGGRSYCVQSCASAYTSDDYASRLFCRCAEEASCKELLDECGPVPPSLVPQPAPAPMSPPPPPAPAPILDAGTTSCASDAGTGNAQCSPNTGCEAAAR